MNNTPENCLARAATARSAAEGPMLESIRRKHLLAAASWEYLARVLRGRSGDRDALPLSKLPEPTSDPKAPTDS